MALRSFLWDLGVQEMSAFTCAAEVYLFILQRPIYLFLGSSIHTDDMHIFIEIRFNALSARFLQVRSDAGWPVAALRYRE